MHKLSVFLIGCGIVAVVATFFKPLGVENWVAGAGLLFLAYVVFYLPK